MTLLQTHRKRVGAKERTISGPWAFLPGLLIVAFLAWTPPSLFAETMNVIIGTGSPAGLYYPTGTTMAKLVNQ